MGELLLLPPGWGKEERCCDDQTWRLEESPRALGPVFRGGGCRSVGAVSRGAQRRDARVLGICFLEGPCLAAAAGPSEWVGRHGLGGWASRSWLPLPGWRSEADARSSVAKQPANRQEQVLFLPLPSGLPLMLRGVRTFRAVTCKRRHIFAAPRHQRHGAEYGGWLWNLETSRAPRSGSPRCLATPGPTLLSVWVGDQISAYL